MQGLLKEAAKQRATIVLLLQGDNGSIEQKKVALQAYNEQMVQGFSYSDNKDRSFGLERILGVRHWIGVE